MVLDLQSHYDKVWVSDAEDVMNFRWTECAQPLMNFFAKLTHVMTELVSRGFGVV